jgi:peptide/nickel transport system substrate-binding protein
MRFMSQDRSRKFFSLVVLLAMLTMLVAGCVQPVPMAPADAPAAEGGEAAGEEAAAAAAGEIVPGGTWTEASSADASNLNPILMDDTASSDIANYFYPALIGQDPNTGELVAGFGSMSESWTVSDDGLTWTFKLHEGVTWSDGDPVDSADFVYTYNAINSDLVESPRKYYWEQIESIEAPDPSTVVVTFKQVKCDALVDLAAGWLPSHLYAADFSDIMTGPEIDEPRVSAGIFKFQSWARDDNIIVVRNEDYWEGAPLMDGSITRVVPDAGARLAQIQSGEIDYLEGAQPNQIETLEQDPDLARFQYYDDGYDYIGLNLANPANPQNGRDEDGNLIPQDPHPILGDVRVRQAIAHAIDYQSIIDDIMLGQGYSMAANVLPVIEWAVHPDLQPYTYDLEQAQALLEEAGWVDGDGDGVREKDGMPMNLSLITNAGNTTREDIGVYMQDQLGQIGINVDFQAIDFGTMLEQMDAQTYDMYIIAWTGLGSDPNDESFWSSNFDVVGSGFNNTSFQNERVEELLVQGYSVPGCAPADRAPYYHEIQEIIHEELPYIFLRGRVSNDFYNKDWANVDPGEWNFKWNMDTWYKQSLQPAVAP